MSKFKRKKLKKQKIRKQELINTSKFETPSSKKQLIIDKEAFDILKNDKKFVSVVTLGKLFNALMSSLDNYSLYADDNTARETRQKFAAFFATLGYLYESIVLFDKLKVEFGNDPAFINTIGKLLSNPKIKEFSKQLLLIRNNTAFHFSDKVTKQILHELRFDEYIFLSFDSDRSGGMHFELSDNININYYTKGLKTALEEEKALRELLSKSSNLMKRTAYMAQKFIWAYMNSLIIESPDLGIFIREI